MILVIAEKAKIAKKFASAMGLAYKSGGYRGRFQGLDITIMTASGHLLCLKYPNEINPNITWDSIELFRNIPRDVELRVQDAPPNARKGATPADLYYKIESELRKKDLQEVWLATDADAEGELLGWEILDFAKYEGPVKRIWLSRGEDKSSILKAIDDRFDGQKTRAIAHAADARRNVDWMYMFLVRTYTYFGRYQALGKNLGAGSGKEGVVSVGRVQTTALAMVVKRDIEIEQFVKQNHFTIDPRFSKGDVSIPAKLDLNYAESFRDSEPEGIEWLPQGKPDEEKPDKPLFVDRNKVQDFIERLGRHGNSSTVSEYTEGTRYSNPPNPYSLTDAQADIGKKLKISGTLVQHIISDLYEQGLISYPRTPHSELPESLYTKEELGATLKAVGHHDDIRDAVKACMSIHVEENNSTYAPFRPKAFAHKEMAHHGLIPTHVAISSEKLRNLAPSKKDDKNRIPHTSQQMAETYLLVVKRFVQAMLPPAQLATQKGKVIVSTPDLLGNKESTFSIKGERIVDKGFMQFFPSSAKDSMFPPLSKNENISFEGAELKSESTKPPSRYSESGLPKEMENVAKHITDPKYKKIMKHAEGIGTVATRGSIIETLISRGYIECIKGVYHSTPKGRDLISIVPKQFSSPETTAIWEEYLSQIKDKEVPEAIKMKNAFIEKQAVRIEKLISHIIDTFKPKMGEKRSAAPKKVSDKMKSALDKISKAKGEPLPRGIKSNPEMASNYIKDNIDLIRGGSSGNAALPSDAQKKMLERILKAAPNAQADERIWTDKVIASNFISENIKKIPPTDGQIKFAKKIAESLEDKDKPSDEIFASASLCSEFIDKFKSKQSKDK